MLFSIPADAYTIGRKRNQGLIGVTIPAGALGNTVKTHRVAARLTLAQLAEKLDISPNHLQRIESEKSLPSVPLLYKLAYILNFSIDEAFFNAGEKENASREALQRRVMACGEHELQVLLATANALLGH